MQSMGVLSVGVHNIGMYSVGVRSVAVYCAGVDGIDAPSMSIRHA
jgi:hypothetical protein